MKKIIYKTPKRPIRKPSRILRRLSRKEIHLRDKAKKISANLLINKYPEEYKDIYDKQLEKLREKGI